MRVYAGIRWFIPLFAALLWAGIVPQNVIAAKCPCDYYADGGTPCVAAHSMVRALYSSYNGHLYQIKRVSDKKTIEIGVLTAGGAANTAPQDSFLTGTTGRISIIYDQSDKGNDLVPTPFGSYWEPEDTAANPADAKIKLNGHTVYGMYTYGSFNSTPSDTTHKGVGYRNNKAKGLATGNAAEGMYMVCDAKHYNAWCCFDYGNAETNGIDDGAATMECIYYGSSTQFEHCGGTGPWIRNDMENGMSCGAEKTDTSNHSIDYKNINFLTAIVKGKATNWYSIKGGDAQKGKLKVIYAGHRPSNAGGSGADYYPLKLQGGIVLGTGGDNSHSGIGTFFEGAITIGCPPDSTEDSVQANIVAAGFGSSVTMTRRGGNEAETSSRIKVNFNPQTESAVIDYALQDARRVNVKIVDQRGRRVAEIAGGVMAAGSHEAIWDTKQVPAGVYFWRMTLNGRDERAGKIIVEK